MTCSFTLSLVLQQQLEALLELPLEFRRLGDELGLVAVEAGCAWSSDWGQTRSYSDGKFSD